MTVVNRFVLFFKIFYNTIHEYRDCQAIFTNFVNSIYKDGAAVKTFGERLKEARTERHLKQTDIAQMLNVSGNTIHAWETDKQEPSMATILKLSEILEVSLDYLFGRKEY